VLRGHGIENHLLLWDVFVPVSLFDAKLQSAAGLCCWDLDPECFHPSPHASEDTGILV